MQEFSRRIHTITFVDTCPSELIHVLSDKIIIFSHLNYANVEIDEIQLKQFKNTRTSERKLKAQDYVIECFEKKKIVGYGTIKWNTQRIALSNAKLLLTSGGLISENDLQTKERLDIAGENVSIGHLLSLAWYAVSLCTSAREIAIWTKFENKKQGIILMDLLPGDSIESSRNLNIVRHIIKKSILDGMFSDQIKDKKLDQLAFGYGSIEGSTKDLKNSPPSTVLDWITQSFYCKLRCEKIVRDEMYDSNIQFTKLANYLIKKKFILIEKPFYLTE